MTVRDRGVAGPAPDTGGSGSTSGAATFSAQAANKVFAGPASGANAVPTFRTLTVDDLPPGLGIGPGGRVSMPAVSVKRTSDYTTQATNAVIPFDTVEFDDVGTCWASGAPTKLVVPAAWDGLRVEIHAEGIWAGDADGAYREFKVLKNGDTSTPVAVVQHAPTRTTLAFS